MGTESLAEKRAKEYKSTSICSSLNLDNIKNILTTFLKHIGDNGIFSEYTMHDITHVDGMLNLLEKIIPDKTKDVMTKADWLMIVMAIYFHDLGMFVSKEEYNQKDKNESFNEYKKRVLEEQSVKHYTDNLNKDDSEKFLYQQFVRQNHGQRIYDWIVNNTNTDSQCLKYINDIFNNFNEDFKYDLATICKSHQENLYDGLEVDKAYGSAKDDKVNLLYAAILLRTADLLHVTKERTPELEYIIKSPENEISKNEWAKQRAVTCIDVRVECDEQGKKDNSIPQHTFEIQASFDNAEGYFSFVSYVDEAIVELKKCHEIAEKSQIQNNNAYYFPWKGIDKNRIQAKGFCKEKLKFELDQQNILKLLTGHTLYNDSTVVLRELIQNAIDAGRFQKASGKGKNYYQPKVEIEWNSGKRILRISDNGTGMDSETISNFLLKVGASKYNTEEFKKNNPGFHSISRFGIGLLTCFMVSDDVDIYTLCTQENQCHLLKIRNLHGEYLMQNNADTKQILEEKHGTTIELKIRDGIKMDDIENEIKQWIITPESEVTLSIDKGEVIPIGFSTETEILKDYVKKNTDITIDDKTYKIHTYCDNDIKIACLLKFNEYTGIWSFYHLPEKLINTSPVGLCIEGIRVTNSLPGLSDRKVLLLANCIGQNAPSTNVARNDIENNENSNKAFSKIFSQLLNVFVSQIEKLKEKRSITWVIEEINFQLGVFIRNIDSFDLDKQRLFNNALKYVDCCLFDNGKELMIRCIEKNAKSILHFR